MFYRRACVVRYRARAAHRGAHVAHPRINACVWLFRASARGRGAGAGCHRAAMRMASACAVAQHDADIASAMRRQAENRNGMAAANACVIMLARSAARIKRTVIAHA